MECKRSQVGAVTVLSPKSALVHDDAEQFAADLREALDKNYGRLVVDFSETSFIDSRGLEVLVEATEHLAQSGQSLKLCGTNELIREVLDLTELDSLFEHFEDANAAARSYL